MTRPCARVLVCVGGDVGDEFLRREREEAGEREWSGVGSCAGGVGGGGRREAGEGEVVCCYGVGDLEDLSVGMLAGTERVVQRSGEAQTYDRSVVVHFT